MLNAPERRTGVELPVLSELHRCETVGVENVRKPLDGGGFSVNPVGLRVPPDEDMNKARWVLGLLPHLVAQRSWFVRTNVGDKLVYRGEALFERLWTDFIARELPDLRSIALNVGHPASLWYSHHPSRARNAAYR